MWKFWGKPITFYKKWKRHIGTLKTLNLYFKNVLFELKYVLDVIWKTFNSAFLQLWKILQETLYPVYVISDIRHIRFAPKIIQGGTFWLQMILYQL